MHKTTISVGTDNGFHNIANWNNWVCPGVLAELTNGPSMSQDTQEEIVVIAQWTCPQTYIDHSPRGNSLISVILKIYTNSVNAGITMTS